MKLPASPRPRLSARFIVVWRLIIPAVLLVFFGLVTIASTQSPLLLAQLLFGVVGLSTFFILGTLDSKTLKNISVLLYIVATVALLATLFAPEIRGTARWIMIGPVRIQPSELAKPLYLVFFAHFLSRQDTHKWTTVPVAVALFAVPVAIIFAQPDLGNAVVYIMFFAAMLLIAGLPIRGLFALGLLGTIATVSGFGFLQEYQKARIASFLSPATDPQGVGYNALQAIIAVGSGGIFGRGFGRGVQSHLRFLPEHHTDFIFASFAEEFGLVGAGVLIGSMFYLLWYILRTGTDTHQSTFVRIYSTGLFAQLFVQVVINIGMNIGLLPITGITLPLVSYGGSSLFATFAGLGLFAALATRGRTTTLAIGQADRL